MMRTRYTAIGTIAGLSVALVSLFSHAKAQDSMDRLLDASSDEALRDVPVIASFKTTRLVNAHTFETVKGGTLDFRIAHRFGDIAGDNGGVHSFYGLDNAEDIRIAFEYGITGRLTASAGRSKGAGIIREVWDGHLKYRLLWQTTDGRMPLSAAVMAGTAVTSMTRSSDSTSGAYLPSVAHRFSYTVQAIIGRKFSERLSLELVPLWNHRNFVADADRNDLFALGAAGRFKFTRNFGIIIDYYYIFDNASRTDAFRATDPSFAGFFNPLGIGIEIETGGHVFHINFTNSSGIIENQFIPYSTDSWFAGEFRLGFNISRVFTVRPDAGE